MIRLAFFGIVIVIAVIVWIVKQAAGAATGNKNLQNSTFKGQTQQTMDTAARGLNWLDKQWDEAKAEAQKGKGIASREFKDYDSQTPPSHCPMCGFCYGWNGGRCKHCNYQHGQRPG